MKKVQKRQVLDIVESLKEVHEEIRERLGRGEASVVQTALADCQEAAIQMGEAIEQIEGEGTEAVSCLERYCERLYQVNLQLDEIAAQKAYKYLTEALIKVENAIRHIPIKKTVVFLPYKASMWDSMASVWKAASEDEEWDSLVMPIPYFGKNTDGSLGGMKYEGADFPADVPILNWMQYSLEEQQPDIIFIHNPYDQYNLLTTVHPLFYASKIREYTDKLVYIPYFVHQNDHVKDDGYCVLPGTLYADVVVLQSEKVRQQYIKYYTEALPELVEKQGMETIERKFLALGSPKFDTMRDEEADIPEEWKPFLTQGKKLFFFNTHWTLLTKECSEQFLKKLDYVFHIFKDRDDAVLLWRPHPLMLETIRSKDPEMEGTWLALVERYKKEKIGIYDDSKDFRRAVNLADAYYGSQSSVEELFRHQGKPIMIMNWRDL